MYYFKSLQQAALYKLHVYLDKSKNYLEESQ